MKNNSTPHLGIGRELRLAASMAILLGAIAAAHAQSAPPPIDTAGAPAAAQDGGDPPNRVARLNFFEGPVTYEPAGGTDWAYASLNRPLTTGDQVWVDANGRSELHIGSTALRMGAQTSLDLVNLSDSLAQLKVLQGTFEARVRTIDPGSSYEIDTPNLALQITTPGIYRVDVAPDGSSTTVTVRAGSATAYGNGGSAQIEANQRINYTGTGLAQADGGGAPGTDAFDQWVASRDAAEDNAVSARYVSREIPGYEDLDANGTWHNDPSYGEVWVPRAAVSAGWAPYHEGHWAWVAPWGWTWIDDAPWGFAPFHYGRWAYVQNNWAWVPGPVEVSVQPVYAPALVAFVGGGGGGGGVSWGVNLSIGGVIGAGVAWIPLGPGEAWRPAYRASPGYYSRMNYNSFNHTTINNYNNSTHVTNITNNTYINRGAPGGITAVPANAFVQGRGVAQAGQTLRPEQIAHAQIGAGSPAIAPVKASFMPGQRIANTRPPQALASRQVVATHAPVTPAAFHDALAARYAQSGGRVAGAGEPVVRNAAPAGAGAALGSGGNRGAVGFQVVQAHHPVAPTGAAIGNRPAMQAEQAPHGAMSNGVPHPPTAGAANQQQNRQAAEMSHAQAPAQVQRQVEGGAPTHAANLDRPEAAHENATPHPPAERAAVATQHAPTAPASHPQSEHPQAQHPQQAQQHQQAQQRPQAQPHQQAQQRPQAQPHQQAPHHEAAAEHSGEEHKHE